MKIAIKHLGMMLLLCVPLATQAQDKETYRMGRERAMQIAANVERTIRTREPKWKLKKTLEAEFSSHQYFESGTGELTLSIYVYGSTKEASKELLVHAMSSSVAAHKELPDIGDEAFYMSHRYFSWLGVRKGRMLVEVRGPGPELTITKRFVQHALAQVDGK